MKVTYFSWLRSEIGEAHQEFDLPENIKTVENLIGWLCEKGLNYQKVFANRSVINVSVNDELVRDFSSKEISDTDSVSFFSPMAGG